MANPNVRRGFVPSRYLNGSAWNGAVNMYYIPSTDASVISVGDPVKSVALSDANGTMGVQKAAGTDAVRGVVVGFLPAPPFGQSFQAGLLDLAIQNLPATKTKAYYALVVDDPFVLFELQDDGLAALTATAVNKNAIFTVANPTAPSFNSASVLSTASVAVTATLNLKIMGLIQRDDNAFGVNAAWLVKFNLHELLGGTAGV
jgi:hypothetical protein